jgi:Cu-Zn family superoxide dismutase
MGNSNSNLRELVAVISGQVNGVVVFKNNTGFVEITYNINGLKPNTFHGFHIHESGDLRDGCTSLCAHYNPHNKTHGDLKDEESHAGDLGNIYVNENGLCAGKFLTNKFCLHEILGRSVIVHEDLDDLGKSNEKDSKTTGHSGKRIGCGVIGRSKNCA